LRTILSQHSNKSHLLKSGTPAQLVTVIVSEHYRLKDKKRPSRLPLWNWERSIRVLEGELKQALEDMKDVTEPKRTGVVMAILREFAGFNWEGFSDLFMEDESMEGSGGEEEEDGWLIV
jgi:hypothetical protein